MEILRTEFKDESELHFWLRRKKDIEIISINQSHETRMWILWFKEIPINSIKYIITCKNGCKTCTTKEEAMKIGQSFLKEFGIDTFHITIERK